MPLLGGKVSTRGTLLGIVGLAIVQSCTDSVEPGTGAIEEHVVCVCLAP